MKTTRYVVRACDNGGSVEGLVRDRTWLIVEKVKGEDGFTRERVVADVLTRAQAYAIKRGYEADMVAPDEEVQP